MNKLILGILLMGFTLVTLNAQNKKALKKEVIVSVETQKD